MEPTTRSIEELHRSETGKPFTSLKLPTLRHQRSLQNLIEEELSFQDDRSLEMAPLGRRDEAPHLDGAITETPASETQDKRPKTSADSTTDERSCQHHKAPELHNDTPSTRASFWRRFFKR